MNSKPLVSVLMTAYNREDYIAEAIESVIASSYENFELIIVDDVSRDNTLSIAKRYEDLDPRVKVFQNRTNLGDYPNRNMAASFASGKYLKYIDSDDLIYDWGLEFCVEKMEQYPDAGMGIFQNKNNIDQDVLNVDQACRFNFFEQPFLNIGPSGTILRKTAFDKIGGYNTKYGVPSDMYFNLKMGANYPIVILKKTFFHYRVHAGQEIHNNYAYLYNNYPYIRDAMMLPEMPLTLEEKNIILLRSKKKFLKHALRYGANTMKVRKVFSAFKHSRISLKDLFLAGISKK